MTAPDSSNAAEAPDGTRVVVYLGNRAAIQVSDDPTDLEAAADEGRAPNRVREPLPEGKRRTTVVLAPGTSLMEAATQLTHASQGVWQAHSNDPAPAWVASTDPVLARLLASHWGCEVRKPLPDGEPRDTTGDQVEEG